MLQRYIYIIGIIHTYIMLVEEYMTTDTMKKRTVFESPLYIKLQSKPDQTDDKGCCTHRLIRFLKSII